MGLGIRAIPCKCSPVEPSPSCPNRFEYPRDYIDGKAVGIRECPNRFDDSELWPAIRTALWEIKDWDRVLGFYGVPVSHLSVWVYDLLSLAFDARDRYHAHKAEKES